MSDEGESDGNLDYAQLRSIADEAHWNDFVPLAGGKLVAPLITRQGVKNADYLFPEARVVAELKVLETEFGHSPQALVKVADLLKLYPGIDPDDPTKPLRAELLKVLRAPLQRIVNKANRQIKETKQELGLIGWRGIIIIVNDGFRAFRPGVVMGLIASILAGKSYSSNDCFIYQTNHCVELPDNPYAVFLWAPLYSERADDSLVEFVNELGRKWRKYSEDIEGPYDYNGEQESTDLANAAVVTGPYRTRRYEGE